MGLLQRGDADKSSRVVLKVVRSTKRPELHAHIESHIEKGSEVHTDALASYEKLPAGYIHNVVDHAKEYVAAMSTPTDWKTSGACSSAPSKAPTLALNLFTCSVIWMSKPSGSMNATALTQAGS